ncbi:MAG: hypothetical protein H6740_11350 [Alphaproteobacteria bacterium]|nr:hypothetical protein [Alphaproteobacteria bacterium]
MKTLRTLIAAVALGLASLSGVAQAAEECAQPSTLSQLNAASVRGEQAFADLDLDALTEARDEAVSLLPCLSEPITPSQAAAYHRLMGMHAFASGQRDLVVSEFHAARKLVPGYVVPESVAPEGHPLIQAYEQAVLADEGTLTQPIPPLGGYVTVGGVRGAARPSKSPVIVQVFDADDQILETRYIAPGSAMPDWGPPAMKDPELRVPFLIATSGSLLATGALYGVARNYRGQFDDVNTPASELGPLRNKTNAAALAAMGMGVATFGLATITIVTW